MNRSFIERGGWWVIAQSVLMVGVMVLAVVFRGGATSRWWLVGGSACIAVGAIFGLAGVAALEGSRTAFPKPRENSQLVQTGIYAYVRHPLYTSVVLVCVGWALVWVSWVALMPAAALAPLFYGKARVEERWLRQRYPEYADYERRVRRFIPGVL